MYLGEELFNFLLTEETIIEKPKMDNFFISILQSQFLIFTILNYLPLNIFGVELLSPPPFVFFVGPDFIRFFEQV